MGRLIPAGTGLGAYKRLTVDVHGEEDEVPMRRRMEEDEIIERDQDDDEDDDLADEVEGEGEGDGEAKGEAEGGDEPSEAAQ